VKISAGIYIYIYISNIVLKSIFSKFKLERICRPLNTSWTIYEKE